MSDVITKNQIRKIKLKEQNKRLDDEIFTIMQRANERGNKLHGHPFHGLLYTPAEKRKESKLEQKLHANKQKIKELS